MRWGCGSVVEYGWGAHGCVNCMICEMRKEVVVFFNIVGKNKK